MNKLLKTFLLCAAFVLAFSFSTFAKDNSKQNENRTVGTRNSVNASKNVSSRTPAEFSKRLNLAKARCEEGDLSQQCLDAISKIIYDYNTGASCATLISDAWNLLKDCWKDIFGQSANLTEKDFHRRLQLKYAAA